MSVELKEVYYVRFILEKVSEKNMRGAGIELGVFKISYSLSLFEMMFYSLFQVDHTQELQC